MRGVMPTSALHAMQGGTPGHNRAAAGQGTLAKGNEKCNVEMELACRPREA